MLITLFLSFVIISNPLRLFLSEVVMLSIIIIFYKFIQINKQLSSLIIYYFTINFIKNSENILKKLNYCRSFIISIQV